MKHSVRTMISGVLGMVVLLSATCVSAEGWKAPSAAQMKAGTTRTLKKMDAGAKKLVRGTVDVITLRPLWDKKDPSPAQRVGWNGASHTQSSRKAPEKSSSWWPFGSKKDERPQRVEDFIGQERPS